VLQSQGQRPILSDPFVTLVFHFLYPFVFKGKQ
jgi:hypothetical protein